MHRRKNKCRHDENYDNNGYDGNNGMNRYNMDAIRDDSIRNVEEAINNGEEPTGVVRNFNNGNNSIPGENYDVVNRNNFNNYYNRYNNYNVTDMNYVRNFVQDINIIHYDNQTVYMGTQYMGSRTIIADDYYNNNNSNCNNPCRRRG